MSDEMFPKIAEEQKHYFNPVIRRVWAMPNPWTFNIKPIRELILKYMLPNQTWIDPFAGSNPFNLKISNDLNPELPTTHHLDAVEFLQMLSGHYLEFDGCLFDPPYTLHQTNQVYRGFGLRKPISLTKDLIVSLIKTGGYVICCGHNSGGMGINRGFELLEVLLVPHGGSHDDTIVTVERKK